MGVTKTELFTPFQNDLAAMAKALAHPARIAILEQIIKHGQCICGDLVHKLPLSQSTVSQHLKAMKEAGILKGEVDGTYRCYCVNLETCQKLMNSIKAMFSNMTNCC